MHKKVIVIGGGFAGLTAAVYLAKNNHIVTLLEASPKLGGRAYSFLDQKTNTVLDNGQHILMGCYYETLNFLALIGALENFLSQKKLEVNFIEEGFQVLPLKTFPFFYPFDLLLGVLQYKAINFSERLALIKIFFKLPFYSGNKLSQLRINEWLKKENQSKNVRDSFWRILAVGALNTSLEKASAKIFVDILRQIFLSGKRAATIILPKYGLSESYCKNAEEFIRNNGGEVVLSEAASELSLKDGSISEVHTSNKVYSDFDFVITTIPAFALYKIIDKEFQINIPKFIYSSILNIHLWMKDKSFPEGFYGLINSPIHWVFNKGEHLNLVISDASELVNKPDEEIMTMVKDEMNKYFLTTSDSIINYKIIKEKRATFIPSSDINDRRPPPKTKIENLVLAGDWVDTGLPSTIESAVKSGRLAAEIVISAN
jgi:squalene-associated FAD-dependent desaturase